MSRLVRTIERELLPIGDEQITNLSASVGLTVPAKARVALLQAEAKTLRFRDSGSAPTATVGIRLLADSVFWFTGDLAALRFIEETAGGILNVSYYQ